jgi:hypothetical protein
MVFGIMCVVVSGRGFGIVLGRVSGMMSGTMSGTTVAGLFRIGFGSSTMNIDNVSVNVRGCVWRVVAGNAWGNVWEDVRTNVRDIVVSAWGDVRDSIEAYVQDDTEEFETMNIVMFSGGGINERS